MIIETRKRLLVKALLWRSIAGLITFMVAFFGFTSIGTAATAAITIAFIDQLLKLGIYYFYEKLWAGFIYGKELMKKEGATIWLTGLSGAGKTTIAKALVKKLEDRLCKVDYLDGDIVRGSLCADLGFSKEDRDENIRRVTYVAAHVSSHSIVICSFISPYKKARDKARQITKNFIEVYVDCPLTVCETRDVKGLYAKARAGNLPGFTGIDDPYEAPDSPDIHLRTDIADLDACVDEIVAFLESKSLL